MPRLPSRFAAAILTFAPLFSHRSWQQAQVLLIGAILAPGKRTVASLLRISGLARERRFANYHRVQLPSGAEPRGLGPAGRVPPAVGPPARRFRAQWAGVARHRRHDRAAARQAHRRQRDLPRPGALLARPLREGVRPALAQPDAVGAGALGGAGLGAAAPHRPGALGAPLPRARQTAQEAHRLGEAVGLAGPPVDAGTRTGAGR